MRPSTDDDDIEPVGVYSSILISGLRSLGMAMDGIESWSANEAKESRLFLLVVTDMLTSPLFFMAGKDEVLKGR